MVVKATVKGSKLVIRYLGEVVNGKQTYVSKTYPKVKAAAADQDILDTASAITALQTKPVYSVGKVVDSELINQ